MHALSAFQALLL
ncbi:hypothetical protein B5E50_05595 [Bacteroides xylanisolvens]|uniref:Uncharacterized protein n=1 Tax=Bacteroides xylanisolvens TaxID=371601 RepID=A0A1Y4VII9_9BACE|nr:hypothetical protein B5E52_10375 [Bacteroides xylanisolvens]OUQ72111.1 hypothetical protein B5E50_05595 [Bacteroides xylanisolvens]